MTACGRVTCGLDGSGDGPRTWKRNEYRIPLKKESDCFWIFKLWTFVNPRWDGTTSRFIAFGFSRWPLFFKAHDEKCQEMPNLQVETCASFKPRMRWAAWKWPGKSDTHEVIATWSQAPKGHRPWSCGAPLPQGGEVQLSVLCSIGFKDWRQPRCWTTKI